MFAKPHPQRSIGHPTDPEKPTAMTFKFVDDGRRTSVAERLWHRLVTGRRNWHNRMFTSGQSIEGDASGWTLRWRGRGTWHARGIDDLPRHGGTASILASGPSVRSLQRPERLFEAPVACVNGSVSLAHELGRRATYLIVNDFRFIKDKPDLFRTGARIAEALVLCPAAAFMAMLETPDVLEHGRLFLKEDLRRPFKRPRPAVRSLRNDARMIFHPTKDIGFSLDPARGTFPAGTVVFDAIQLLFGIGYQELFMFGVDFSAAPRFYREDVAAPTNLADAYERSIEPAFETVREYLRRSGKRLVNGSLESRLPASLIPKADGNDLLAKLASADGVDVRAAWAA